MFLWKGPDSEICTGNKLFHENEHENLSCFLISIARQTNLEFGVFQYDA